MSRVTNYATDLMAEELGFDSKQRQEIFLFSAVFDRLWGPTGLVSNWYWKLFLWGYSGRTCIC
jgi:hypothetical protein